MAPTDAFCHIHGFSVSTCTVVFAEKRVLSCMASHLCPSRWMDGIPKVAIQEETAALAGCPAPSQVDAAIVHIRFFGYGAIGEDETELDVLAGR